MQGCAENVFVHLLFGISCSRHKVAVNLMQRPSLSVNGAVLEYL